MNRILSMEDIPIRASDGLHIMLNRDTDPLFLFFDYDERSKSENMEFQHFHTYYEMMIPVDESSGHMIEGQYYNTTRAKIRYTRPIPGIFLKDQVQFQALCIHQYDPSLCCESSSSFCIHQYDPSLCCESSSSFHHQRA